MRFPLCEGKAVAAGYWHTAGGCPPTAIPAAAQNEAEQLGQVCPQMLSNPWNEVYREWCLVSQLAFGKQIQFPPFRIGVNYTFRALMVCWGTGEDIFIVWSSLFTESLRSKKIQQQFPCSQFPVLPAQPAPCLQEPRLSTPSEGHNHQGCSISLPFPFTNP